MLLLTLAIARYEYVRMYVVDDAYTVSIARATRKEEQHFLEGWMGENRCRYKAENPYCLLPLQTVVFVAR